LRELFTRRINQHLFYKNERFFLSRHIQRICSNCFSLNIVYCRWETHDKEFSQVCFDCEYFD
jgi:DNA polymerase III delta subunit